MSTYSVDDSDGVVVYSKPANGGHWSKQNSGTSYQNGLMLTRTRNANATLSFTGTSISVYGLVSPRGVGSTQMSFYSVDGQASRTYSANPTSETQSQVLFYNSGTIPNGQHTLVLINLIEADFFWIDYFEITTASEPRPSSGETTVSPPVSGQITTRPAAASPIQTTVVSTQVFTSIVTESSTTRVSIMTSVKSDVVQVDTASALDTQPSIITDASQSGVSSIDGASSASESKAPIGAIIGGVVGGIAVIILALILFVLLKRRRRRANINDEIDGMTTAGQLASLVPFVDAPAVSPTGNSSAYSQPSSQPSGSQYGGLNQSHMAAGHSGATYNAAIGLPATGPTGKRQYANTIDEANSSSAALLGGRHREMEQAYSSTTLSSTSGYSYPLNLSPMAIDDLPPSYQAAAASQTGENPVLQGMGNMRKS